MSSSDIEILLSLHFITVMDGLICFGKLSERWRTKLSEKSGSI